MSHSLRKQPSRRAAYIASTFRSLAATGAGLLSLASTVKATDYLYTGGGTGTAAIPVSGLFSTGFTPTLADGGGTATDRLLFAGAPTANLIATDDFTLAITTNAIQFNNTSAFTFTLARGGAGTSNLINLAGSNPYISFSNTVAGSQVIDNLDHAFLANGYITKTTNPNNGNANPIMNGALSLGANSVTVALLDTGGDASAELTINGSLTGTGALTLNSTVAAATAGSGAGNVPGTGVTTDSFGTLLISANNSAFSGAVNITKGRLIVNNDNALGTGLITVGGAAGTLPNTGDGGVLALGGNQSGAILYGGLQGAATGFTLPNAINLGGEVSGGRYGIGLFNNGGANTLSGVTTLTQATVNVQINNLSTLTFSQPLVQGVAGAGINKSGNGLLVLNNDTGTALKTIAVGNLDFTGTAPTAAGSVTLSAGAALNVGQANDAFPTVQSALSSGVINTASTGSVAITGNNAETINFTGYATLGLGATAAGANYSGALTPNPTNYRLGGGGGTLTVSGTNTLTGANGVQIINGPVVLAGANNFTGGLTLTNNTLTLGAAGDIGTTGTITFGGGTLQFTAADTTDYSPRFSTAAGQQYILDTNGQNVTLANAFATTGGNITKLGLGTLTLGNGTAARAYGAGNFFVRGGTAVLSNGVTYTGTAYTSIGQSAGDNGTLTLQGNASFLNGGNDLNVSDVVGTTGTLNMNSTGTITGGSVFVGKTGSAAQPTLGILNQSSGTITPLTFLVGAFGTGQGIVNQSGGSITRGASGGDWRLGGNSGNNTTAVPADQNAVGIYNLSGGTLTPISNFQIGGSGQGAFFQTGGTVNSAAFTDVGRFAGSYGVLDVSGTGVFNQTGATTRLFAAENGFGIITARNGGLITVAATGGLTISLGGTTAGGVLNVNQGGTVQAASINTSGTSTLGTAINFNGGTLRAGVAANATFISGIGAANIFSGGAIIDTNNLATTIPQALIAPAGNGVSAITGSGTGFKAPPIVKISAPPAGGTQATALATIDGAGNITGFVITSFGSGYTTAPTVSFVTAGGGTATASTTIAANTSGGLTKIGLGTLTLTGASTYTGPTIINQGTLQETFGANTAARLATTQLTLGGTGLDGTSNGATLSVTGTTAAGGSTQSFSSTLIRQGGTSITTTVGATGIAANLSLGAITRNAGSIVNFTPATTGTITTTNAGTNGILGGWAIENANTFAAVNGGVITPLATYGNSYATADATTNFDPAGTTGTFTNTASNVFRFNNAAAVTSTLNGAYSLTSGGILVTTTVGANATTITGGTSLTSSNGQDIAISQQNTTGTLTIATPITGAIGVTKGGGGTLVLSGASDYSGATSIFNGEVDVLSNTALGTAAGGTTVYAGAGLLLNNVTVAGEALTLNGNNGTVNGVLGAEANTLNTWTGPITLGSTGATATNTRLGARVGATLNLTGAVTTNTAPNVDISGANTTQTLLTPTGQAISGTVATPVVSGTIVFGGATTIAGITNIIRGNLIVDGTAGGAINSQGDINTGGSGSNEASGLSVRNGGSVTTTGNLNVGNGGTSQGALNVTSGSVVLSSNTNGNLFVANNTNATGSQLNISGGTLDVAAFAMNRVTAGTNSFAVANQSGGTFGSRGYFTVGSFGGGTSTYNLTGGTLNVKTSTGNGAISNAAAELEVGVFDAVVATFNQSDASAINLNNNANLVIGSQNSTANNTFNQNAGTVTFRSDNGTTVGGTGALILGRNSASGANVYNLNGGTLTVPTISRANATVTGTNRGTFNFNGGTLTPAQSDNPGVGAGTSTFISGVVGTTISSGGAIIDTASRTATIATALVPGATAGGGLTKNGLGQLNLTASSTYTGTTVVGGGVLNVDNGSTTPLTTAGSLSATTGITVNTGGTLLLSGANTVNNRLNDTAPVTLGGGRLTLAGVAEGTGSPTSLGSPVTNAPGVGALTLTVNSIIDLQGTSVLHFAASGSADPAAAFGASLSIYNWTGTPTTGGGTEQLLFGNSDTNASLTPTQLSQISFYSDSGTTYLGTGVFAGQMNGEIVPGGAVPEPATWLAGALTVGLLGFSQRRRVSTWLGLSRAA